MASRPPEQIIRAWIESNGPVRVGLEAFEETWGIERLRARDRREIPAALARAGVRMEPSLDRISRSEKVLLSLEAPEPEVAEPEVAEPERVEPEPEYVEPELEPGSVEPEPPAEAIRHRRRGRIWTDKPDEARAPEPAALQRPESAGPGPPESSGAARQAGLAARVPRAGWVLLAGVGLMVLGSLGPWAKAVFVTDYGLDRNGALVIIAALVIAVVLGLHLYRGRGSRLPLVSAAVAAFAAAMIASDFRDLVDDPFVGPYWGLYMAFIGSAVVVGLSMALLVRPDPSADTGRARPTGEST